MGDGYRYLVEAEYFTYFRVRIAKKRKTFGKNRLCTRSAHRSGISRIRSQCGPARRDGHWERQGRFFSKNYHEFRKQEM